ncbi:hypothetical protein B0H11DRAFT_340181 [Mycena galericulata]|nr:hypothetical protein B0H11DRAFT_340181 [Mycena galericulata]
MRIHSALKFPQVWLFTLRPQFCFRSLLWCTLSIYSFGSVRIGIFRVTQFQIFVRIKCNSLSLTTAATTMHPALRIRNLTRLPVSSKRVALAACLSDPTVEDINRFGALVDATPADKLAVFLPVHYKLLDPSRIPTAEQLESGSTDMLQTVETALQALVDISIYTIILSRGTTMQAQTSGFSRMPEKIGRTRRLGRTQAGARTPTRDSFVPRHLAGLVPGCHARHLARTGLGILASRTGFVPAETYAEHGSLAGLGTLGRTIVLLPGQFIDGLTL